MTKDELYEAYLDGRVEVFPLREEDPCFVIQTIYADRVKMNKIPRPIDYSITPYAFKRKDFYSYDWGRLVFTTQTDAEKKVNELLKRWR